MKLLIALCVIAVVTAAPRTITKIDYPSNGVSLLRYQNDFGYGGYRYSYEQSNGQKAEQAGELRNAGKENESLAVSGTFQWVGPDGVTYTVNYTADEDGYKPEIEQGPGGGVPPAVVASLLG